MEESHENSVHSGIVNARGCCHRRSGGPGTAGSGQAKSLYCQRIESLDPTAQAAFTPLAQAAMKAAGGRTLNTGGGKVVGIDGPPPPKRVVINEWDSLDQAEAYYKSKAWNDLAPQRDKAIKTIRRYAVESAN
jgi:uncharacterized protein (DUF1330 family)